MAKIDYSAVGRRKKAVARVRLVAGDGKITINKRDIDNYFGLETLKMTVRQPLTLTKKVRPQSCPPGSAVQQALTNILSRKSSDFRDSFFS